MKSLSRVFIFLVIGILSASAVFAINESSGAAVTESNEGRLNNTVAQSLVAEGGNVSNLNLESNSTTLRWQGFVGNVTGNLNLGRNNDVFYNFGTSEIDTVFATTSSSYSWASVEDAAAAQVDTTWGFTSGADQAVDAFTGNGTFETVNTVVVDLTGGFATGLFDNGANAAKDDYVFGANVSTTAIAGFDGGFYQYGLMVPTATGGTDTYFFYVSLS